MTSARVLVLALPTLLAGLCACASAPGSASQLASAPSPASATSERAPSPALRERLPLDGPDSALGLYLAAETALEAGESPVEQATTATVDLRDPAGRHRPDGDARPAPSATPLG